MSVFPGKASGSLCSLAPFDIAEFVFPKKKPGRESDDKTPAPACRVRSSIVSPVLSLSFPVAKRPGGGFFAIMEKVDDGKTSSRSLISDDDPGLGAPRRDDFVRKGEISRW